MQFITNGPEIPDALLQAHEEGRVVFFCGAGISRAAGLPEFDGLVEEIYRLNGTGPSDIEREALARKQFDAALDLLERRLRGQRLAVRRALAQALKPNLRRKGATATHAALLRLGTNRDGALRLVTTNFDRVFHAAAKCTGQSFKAHAAPMLPIAKNSRWNGLAYLHGLLPDKADDTALNQLVVTSGDFGLAYLTERWAARFVSELFRNYLVCFIGYRINDPVLRYMMDALAVDRMLGEVTPKAWALGACEPGQEARKTIEWEAKGVTPILYDVAAGTDDHSALHQTLHAWAETYRDGVTGKEGIVDAHALARPSASTKQDDFVGRMLWALSDPSGLPARRFAEFNPVPSLDWLLDAFAVDRYAHSDLARFGVPPKEEPNAKLQFSLIHRPAPYLRAPPMRLVSFGSSQSQWDNVMHQIGFWLVRHLNDPRLVVWIAKRGGKMHETWARLIEDKLAELGKLEREGKTSELDEIRGQAPNAIPEPMMRTLWWLLLRGLAKTPDSDFRIYRWQNRLEEEGLTTPLRLELRELLSPRICISERSRWATESKSTNSIRQLVHWELVLATDPVCSVFRDWTDRQRQAALPDLLDDLQQLLRDALDLMRELGEANEHSDQSHWYLPSITPDPQNQNFKDWVALIELLRDAWLAVRDVDRPRASRIAAAWFEVPYPTFKRLALFAASHEGCIASSVWVEWLLADRAWCLWAENTRREVLRLFVLQGNQLKSPLKKQLESALLAGLPSEIHEDNPDGNQADRAMWLRLAKLNTSGLTLESSSAVRLEELSHIHPDWQLANDERDEFTYWTPLPTEPNYEELGPVDFAPRKRRELVEWLKKPRSNASPFVQDGWRKICRKHPLNSLYALSDLADVGVWPADRWQEALEVWSDDPMAVRSSRCVPPLVNNMPDSVLKQIVRSVARWIRSVLSSTNQHEDILLNLCDRVLNLQLEVGVASLRPYPQPVNEAINHPVGHLTEALLNLLTKGTPKDGAQLPNNIAPLFDKLCDVRVPQFRHGRVLLASRLNMLFRIDRTWTEKFLLPLLNWKDPDEAKPAWEGFLWSPRLYSPLLLAFKPQFLNTAHHYDDLGDHSHQFAVFLTYAALGRIDGYTTKDWRDAIAALPVQGLEQSAQALTQALKGADNQREEYWKNRIKPFWQHVWPKSGDKKTNRITESLAQLSIAARTEFPAALVEIQDWLRPIEDLLHVIWALDESGLCSQFPTEALELLHRVISNQEHAPKDLEKCLAEIVKANPQLGNDPRYRRLLEYFRRRGC